MVNEEDYNNEETYRYPWARSLFLVVLYVAFLIFLWHFPLEGPRAFFQTLLQGFLYILVGLGLTLLSLILLMFILPPPPMSAEDMSDENAFLDDELEDEWVHLLTYGRALFVPGLSQPQKTQEAWHVLDEIIREIDPVCCITLDNKSEIIAITGEDVEEAQMIFDEIRHRLHEIGLKPRKPC